VNGRSGDRTAASGGVGAWAGNAAIHPARTMAVIRTLRS
jgi:hypothetical protein